MSQAEEKMPDKVLFDNVVDSRGVPLGNVLAEVTRKLNRLNEVTSAKLDLLIQGSNKGAEKAPEDLPAISIDENTKRYIDVQLAPMKEEKKLSLEKAQMTSLQTVFETFPELQTSSDSFDKRFFDLAVEYEEKMDKSDPDRPLKAAKLAALEVGKIDKIAKSRILQDENRRSRILSEGSASPKEGGKQSSKTSINKSMVQKYFKIDPAKIEQYAKEEE